MKMYSGKGSITGCFLLQIDPVMWPYNIGEANLYNKMDRNDEIILTGHYLFINFPQKF